MAGKITLVLCWALPLAILLLALSFFVLDTHLAWYSFPLDDAWIHRVYAESLAEGRGFAYNDEQEAGFTSPLWALITAPAHWFSPEWVVPVVKLVGALLALMIAACATCLGTKISGSKVVGLAVGCLLIIDPRGLFVIFSGMESGLLLAIWFGAILALVREKYYVSLTLCALLPVVRPESLLLAPFIAMAFIPWFLEKKYRFIIAAGVVGLPMLLWVLFCLAANGHPLPNTFYTKAELVALGPQQIFLLMQLMSQHGNLPFLVLVVGWILFLHDRISRQEWQQVNLLFVSPFILAIGILATRTVDPAGYYWTRWFESSALFLSVSAILGYGFLCLKLLVRLPDRNKALIGLVPLVLTLASAQFWWSGFEDRRVHLVADANVINKMNVSIGLWLDENTADDAIVGVNDAGAIRFFGKRFTVDLLGLNNDEILFDEDYRLGIWRQLDWLVVYPWLIPPAILAEFEAVAHVQIPTEEYTLCPCPDMQKATIFRRR